MKNKPDDKIVTTARRFFESPTPPNPDVRSVPAPTWGEVGNSCKGVHSCKGQSGNSCKGAHSCKSQLNNSSVTKTPQKLQEENERAEYDFVTP